MWKFGRKGGPVAICDETPVDFMKSGDQSNGTVLDIFLVRQKLIWRDHLVLVFQGLDTIEESKHLVIEFFTRCLGDLLK